MSYSLFDSNIKVAKSLELMEECMWLSRKHSWNVCYQFPDIGVYPDMKPLPTFTWASWFVRRETNGV